MTVVTTVVVLAVTFALGIVAGMISAAGAYTHMQRRHAAAIRHLEAIASAVPGDGGDLAWNALEDDHRLERERLPRALD